MKRMIIISLSTALAAMLAACGGESGEGPPTPTLRPIERPSSTAELSIVSPDNGEVVRGSRVDLRLRLEGATIVPQTSTDLKPDEGHVHVLLDDTLISMIEGLEQVIRDVEPGMHRLTVEFVANDHAPFDPRVVTVVVFEVRA
jgi:hypothetical protein